MPRLSEEMILACERAHTHKRLFEHLRAPRRAPALKIYFTEIKALAKILLQSVAICCSLLHLVGKAKKDVVTLSTKTRGKGGLSPARLLKQTPL